MKKRTEAKAQTDTPAVPSTPMPPAGTPPDRPHPVPPVKQKRESARMSAAADPCASLTNAAIQAVIDKITQSRNRAVRDAAAHGVTGTYASAARDNLVYLTQARDKMIVVRNWLHTAGVLDPPPFVSNTTGAYNIHGYVREAVISLHYASHWPMISAVYHQSANARNSYALTAQALELIEPLGAQAGRCYMNPYGPFR